MMDMRLISNTLAKIKIMFRKSGQNPPNPHAIDWFGDAHIF